MDDRRCCKICCPNKIYVLPNAEGLKKVFNEKKSPVHMRNINWVQATAIIVKKSIFYQDKSTVYNYSVKL